MLRRWALSMLQKSAPVSVNELFTMPREIGVVSAGYQSGIPLRKGLNSVS
jgi:hypothetical protein